MAQSPILYKTRETNPILDFGSPLIIGTANTGSFILTSSVASHGSIYPSVMFSASNLNTNEDSICIVPIFPSGTIPKRFTFEASFSYINTNALKAYFIIGTENSSSNGFNGMAFSFDGAYFGTISNGIFSASNKTFGGAWYSPNAYKLSFIKKEFEFRTQTFTTGSDVVFRCREFTTTSEENGASCYDTVYRSDVDFPASRFPVGWNNKTFNKIFFGFTATGFAEGFTIFDLIRVRKHIMDWDS